MYRIIIFGTGSTAELVIRVIKDECKIIAFVDNNPDKLGVFKDTPVIEPEKIEEIEYDYIIIASQYNEEIYNQLICLGVKKTDILQFFRFVDREFNYLKRAIEDTLESTKLYEAFATGISYCNFGLKEELLIKNCAKFAFGSQDIYYDYNIIRFLMKNHYDNFKSIKYCLIGLSYYSFQYDMSLSAMKDKIFLYYELLGLCHHNIKVKKQAEDYFISKRISDNIFRVNSEGKYIHKYMPELFVNKANKEELGLEQASIDCDKEYPSTVRENINIFKKYLNLLIDYNIKPIVIVFPTSKYYTKHFSKRIEDEFHSIVDEVKKEYRFQYIDYFRSDLFGDEDFYDVTHLNQIGAEKFTKLLNNIIEW